MNEYDTPDRGQHCYESATIRIAAFGNRNLATHTVSADSKYSQVLARLLRAPLKQPATAVLSHALDVLDIERAQSSLHDMRIVAEPDIVLV